MRLIHIACLGPLVTRARTVVSQPEDETWPKDFVLGLLFCPRCNTYPSFEGVKKELT